MIYSPTLKSRLLRQNPNLLHRALPPGRAELPSDLTLLASGEQSRRCTPTQNQTQNDKGARLKKKQRVKRGRREGSSGAGTRSHAPPDTGPDLKALLIKREAGAMGEERELSGF
ncbi:hypothetical protein F2Q70_00016095 [Brassica cretica]|uniref:Uncharacterized protein n=1 Tax=Brassica cretica TaxID=69181 RepID=A0A8S9L242_BRACR|nr:hypothetical protein F2Q70_00016095 [Brassica cretica]KAF2600745.1 hypothetical protein F2Q68_00009031 [Brassica cretica]